MVNSALLLAQSAISIVVLTSGTTRTGLLKEGTGLCEAAGKGGRRWSLRYFRPTPSLDPEQEFLADWELREKASVID